jgi:signal transduction histidine kinase
MAIPTDERRSAATGLIATAAIGVAALVPAVSRDSAEGPAAVWWSTYVLFVAAFVAGSVLGEAAGHGGRLMLLGTQVVAGLGAVLAHPEYGWSAVLLVVTAATAAYTVPTRAAYSVVALQSVALGVGQAVRGERLSEVVLAVCVYASFQAFAVLVVSSWAREAAARASLAAAHAELRAGAVLLAASTRSAERLRISRDLHDVAGHRLTALGLELEVARHLCGDGAAPHVARAGDITHQLLDDVRQVVDELRTSTDDLHAALAELTEDLPGLEVTLSVEQGRPVDEATALVAIRCVQEIVTNTIRHSGAGRLAIRVVADDEGLHLHARDDGQGATELTPGNGLGGIRERVEHAGGVLRVETGAGRGFALEVEVPAS